MAPEAGAVGLLAAIVFFVAPSAAFLGAARGQFSAGKDLLRAKASRFYGGSGPPSPLPPLASLTGCRRGGDLWGSKSSLQLEETGSGGGCTEGRGPIREVGFFPG